MVILAFALLGGFFVWDKLRFDSFISHQRERINKLGAGLHEGRRSAVGHVRIWYHDQALDSQKLTEIMSIVRILDKNGWVIWIDLEFDESGIHDSDLHLLQGLKKLRSIDLSMTAVTEVGLRELKTLYPEVRIITNNAAPPTPD